MWLIDKKKTYEVSQIGGKRYYQNWFEHEINFVSLNGMYPLMNIIQRLGYSAGNIVINLSKTLEMN